MPKKFYKDQMSQEELAVMLLIASEIKKAMQLRLPLKTIYLQPPYFRIFEELNKKCYHDYELAEQNYEYQVQKVHIKKGSMLQKRPSQVDYWPVTIEERNLNRELIGRAAIN